MAVLKLSQIASAGSPPALTDTVIGVGSGTTDLQYTLTQIKSTVGSAGANPTATASDTAVNGSAATFMRSDAAPAVQKTSASVFGLCKVDGSTVTATGGVISAVGGVATSIDAAGATGITNGTSTHVLYDNAAVVGESSQFTIVSGQPNVLNAKAYLYNSQNIAYQSDAVDDLYLGRSGPGPGGLASSNGQNIGVGHGALASLVSNNRCIAIGLNSLSSSTADGDNVAIGFAAMASISGGSGNLAIGSSALQSAASGAGNTAIGKSAMGTGVNTGSNNVALGASALLKNTSGANNFGMGANALNQNTTGSNNVAIGFDAVFVNVGGGSNIGIGTQTLFTASGDSNNIAIGVGALFTANGGGNNTAVGFSAGQNITTGAGNTIFSFNEGTITSGSNNIAIGNTVGVATATASNQLVIGNYIYGTGLAGTGSTISTAKIGIGIKAPAFNLDVAGSIGQADAAALIHTTGSLNNGAGTGTGVTFTNAPGASAVTGNPTKWIPIDDNGTTRYVPAF